MFLYELALQLDVRSSDLVDQARALGIDAGPSTFLTPEQVQQLRTGVSPSASAVAPPLAAAGLLRADQGAPPPPPPPPPGAPSGPPTGPPMGPPAGPATGGDKQLSPAMVVLYFAVPIVLLLGVFAFLSKGEDDGGSEVPTASGPLGIFGPDDGMTPVGDAAEVTDPGMFCDGWSSIAAMENSAAPSTYAESRAATLEVYPDLALALMIMSRSSDGAVSETANDLREHLSAAVRLHKELPDDETDLTSAQRADLDALGAVSTNDFEYLRFIAVKTC